MATPSRDVSTALPDDFAARLGRMECERRDLEIIIFGLPMAASEDTISLIISVAVSLGMTLAPSEITTSFRIPAGDASRGRPLVARFTTIARRNELLARARRQQVDLVASRINPSWPGSRISLQERSTAAEKRVFNEARRLARAHGVRFVWMRRGVTYIRVSEGSPSFRFTSADELLCKVGVVASGSGALGFFLSGLVPVSRSD
ncbi:hypothetical protein ALC62_05177 [Cyphomyrmex costatus]|uniref:FP protein C-terminal domain-containing protein n=1 Tax=Cyphomyrmex costatus TaxID=456900 RepID=A0A151IK02_9HYME|nr:hypothetical protein ALC62_05177 [Cyphomyrmex costatus]